MSLLRVYANPKNPTVSPDKAKKPSNLSDSAALNGGFLAALSTKLFEFQFCD
jgi:hypothetical protein